MAFLLLLTRVISCDLDLLKGLPFIMPQVFNLGLGMRLCEGRFDKELFSCRNFGILKLST
jgi:hypothetical protein